MPLECGTKLEPGELYNERLILGHVGRSRYFALTPDDEVYEEVYS